MVVSDTLITASLVIPAGTTAGPYDVTVMTQQGTTHAQTFFVDAASTLLTVQGLAFGANPVTSGQTSVGTVTMNTAVPAGGVTVGLLSGNPAAVTVPPSLDIPAGATSATFTASTASVSAATPVMVTASLGSSEATAVLTVNPLSASQLAFQQQPANSVAGATMPAVSVAIQDAAGHIVGSATNPVSLTIGANPAGGTLSGALTVSAVAGVATFSDLSIDKPGSGYTLLASSGLLYERDKQPL